MLTTFKNPSITIYNIAQAYIITKDDEIISKTVNRNGMGADIDILVQRQGEKYPAIITQITTGTTVIAKESTFRKKACIYFRDCSKIVELIKDKELKSNEIEKLATEYDKYKD